MYTPTLTGMGDRVHLAHPGIDLDTHVLDVVNMLEAEDLHQVVLVRYSYDGDHGTPWTTELGAVWLLELFPG